MVYIHSWQEFQDAAESLYAKSPNKARYCVKWKSSEAKLVLKITDDSTCLKFKTGSSMFLNRFEALNLSLMQKMQNSKLHEEPVATSALIPKIVDGRANSPAPTQTPSTLPTASVAGGGVKKKKPKKKK